MLNYETDSRKIKNGQTFIAIKGHTVDGHDYIDAAIKNGANLIISEKVLDKNINHKVVKNSEEYLIDVLTKEYSHEFKDLTFVGITGTNGKTTTAYLTYQLLLSLNINAAYIGTIGFISKNKTITLNNTTPDILELYKLILEGKSEGITHFVMEVSSHALDLKRVEGITFNTVAFTNLSPEHLDYHENMDNYLNAKLKILNYTNSSSVVIPNADDKYSTPFIKRGKNVLTIGKVADYKILNADIKLHKTTLNFEFKGKTYQVTYNLTSEFNVYNTLFSIAIVNSLGFPLDTILKEVKNIKAPRGRCEIYPINNGFAVIDYAHTPDAVEKILTTFEKIKENKIITVIGCGGDRDRTKRPIMGCLASTHSDFVYFTEDNPRTEDTTQIMDDILKGVKKDNYKVIYNRSDAIKEAILNMQENDSVLILGKGHETYQIKGREKSHFDDLEEVKKWKK